MSDVQWLLDDFKEDCERMQRIAKTRGLELSLESCAAAWHSYSEATFANWLSLPADDAVLWRIFSPLLGVGFNFTSEDAETILHMADVCFGEGIGPDYGDLIRRIRAQYPDIAESYSHVFRDGWNLHQNQDEAPARVITRVMDDSVETKDGTG